MVVPVVHNQSLEQTVSGVNQLQGRTTAYIPEEYHIDNNPQNPIRPELNGVLEKPYDGGDITFSLALALMRKRGYFNSMVQDLGHSFDSEHSTLPQNFYTQISKIGGLPVCQRPADLQMALMIDSLRLSILNTGSNAVPKSSFDGLGVRTPVDIAENNGRLEGGIDDNGSFLPKRDNDGKRTGKKAPFMPGISEKRSYHGADVAWFGIKGEYGDCANGKVGWIAVDSLVGIGN